MRFYISLLFICAFAGFPAMAQDFFWQQENEATAPQINNFEIQGNQRVENNTVLSYLNLTNGDRATQSALQESTRSLYATGLFADVSMLMVGNTLKVSVKENPVINKIAFEGNEKLDDDSLLSEINLRPRTVLTRTKVQANVERLNEIYRRNGRFSTVIEPKIIELDQNRVNLIFEIDEGYITKISRVNFVGNKAFNSEQLRAELSTKQKRWYRFLSSNDKYDPDRLNYDQELLRRFYLSEGYADFQVRSVNAELSSDKRSFFVTFNVDEGERYKVATPKIRSDLKNFDEQTLYPLITFEGGEWYNADAVEDTVDAMVEELGNQQYAFVDIDPDVQRDTVNNTITVLFKINETPRVFVEEINIKGNVRTLDKVIRREFELVEGDPFNREKIAQSERNIRDLGFFDKVSVAAKQGDAPDKSVIEAEVSERSTGEISIGAGFSTNDGPLADFRIRERNLLGTGRDLGFTTVLAGERTEFDVSLTEPYFLNRDLRATGNLFRITRDFQDESSFDQKQTGVGFALNYPLSPKLRQTVRYRFEENAIENVSANSSLFIRLQEGVRETNAISQRLTYDERDSRLFPTEGYLLWLDTELAGGLGDAQYVSGKIGGQHYFEFMDSWILSTLGEVAHIQGWGDEEVTINERFFIGSNTLRGFEQSGIGPRDLVTNDALGGNTYYRGSVEVSTPLGFSNLDEMGVQIHAFSDFGSLFTIDQNSIPGVNLADDGSIRVSAGMGLSWRSPFGPLRFDLAQALVKEDYDEEEVFKFSFGTRF